MIYDPPSIPAPAIARGFVLSACLAVHLYVSFLWMQYLRNVLKEFLHGSHKF